MRTMWIAAAIVAAAVTNPTGGAAKDVAAAQRVVDTLQLASIAVGECPEWRLSDDRQIEALSRAAADLDGDLNALRDMIAAAQKPALAVGEAVYARLGHNGACAAMWAAFGAQGAQNPGLLIER